MNSRFQKLLDFKDSGKLLQQVQLDNDPLAQDYRKRILSPVGNGRHSDRAAQKLANMIESQIVYLGSLPDRHVVLPNVAPENALILGYRRFDPATSTYHEPVIINYNNLNEHVGVFGPSGMGKTSTYRFYAGQLVQQHVYVEFIDYKGEGKSIPDAMVFRADQYPWNLLHPKGNSRTYYTAFISEFAVTAALRTETWLDLVGLLLRIERGLKRDDPYPSLKDFERLLYALGQRQDNRKFLTAASAFASLNEILGPTAHIRRAPDISTRYPIIVHDYEGLPLRIYSFLNAMHLLRAKMKASVEGHA